MIIDMFVELVGFGFIKLFLGLGTAKFDAIFSSALLFV